MSLAYTSSPAVGYIRVSTDAQADHGVSLETQRESLTAYALMSKLNLVEVVADKGVSASIPLADRAGGARLLGLVKDRTAEHVVAVKLDRLFRDTLDMLTMTRAWDRAGVAMHLLDHGGQAINTSSALGRMFLTMQGATNEFERNVIAERTSAALRYKKRHRQVYNHTPLGYVRAGNDLHRDLGEQELIARIMDWRRDGMSYGAIAKLLNAEGITGKQGGAFHASTIHKIVGNDLHHGEIARAGDSTTVSTGLK